MGNKYGNKKVEYQEIKFDSIEELSYYKFLSQLKQKGIIKHIELQPRVTIQPSFKRCGKRYMAITYRPDFLVEFCNGKQIYFDLKGMSTQAGELRRKMFAYQNETPLVWVAGSKKYSASGWICWDKLQRLRRENKKLKSGS